MELDINSGMITINEIRNKVIFWDIDGTLASNRFTNHVCDPNKIKNGPTLEEINNGIYLERNPSKFMQKVLNECKSKENIILGHCFNEKEKKTKWCG